MADEHIRVEHSPIEIAPWQTVLLPRVTNAATGETLLDLWDCHRWFGEATVREGKVHLALQNRQWNEMLRVVLDPADGTFTDERSPGQKEPLGVLAVRLGARTSVVSESVLAADYAVDWECQSGGVRYAESGRHVNIDFADAKTLAADSFTHWVASGGYVPVTPEERAAILDRVLRDGLAHDRVVKS